MVSLKLFLKIKERLSFVNNEVMRTLATVVVWGMLGFLIYLFPSAELVVITSPIVGLAYFS